MTDFPVQSAVQSVLGVSWKGRIAERGLAESRIEDRGLRIGKNDKHYQPLEHKLSVVRTLHHRADSVVSDPEDLPQEKQHINKAVYMSAVIQHGQCNKALKPKPPKQGASNSGRGGDSERTTVSIPYVKGTTGKIKRVISSYGIKTYIKPTRKINEILCKPKDRLEPKEVCGPVYKIVCGGGRGEECEETYIGETERIFKARFLEHKRTSCASSEVSRHINKDKPEHDVHIDEARIVDRDPDWFMRGVREAIYIRAHKLTLSRDGGRYILSAIWTRLVGHTSRDLNKLLKTRL